MEEFQPITIIIPTKDAIPGIVNTVESIMNSTSYPNLRILLVEGGSTDGTDKYCDFLSETNKNIITLHINSGCVITDINTAIKSVPDGDIFLTHDDCLFHKLYNKDWMYLFSLIAKEKDAGLLTTCNGVGLSGPTYVNDFKWVGTWAMYIPRRTIEKVGLLDEKFCPGNGDDIDFSYRVEKAGLQIVVVNYLFVDHHRTRVKDSLTDKKIIKRNSIYFKNKHGLEQHYK